MERRHAFGPFLLDVSTGTLSREGKALNVGQRGVALLATLLEAGGEPVSKDELLAKGWPGVIVEEANLSVQIAALRKMLGATETGADWIATVPRFGYRFLRQPGILNVPEHPTALRPTLAVLPLEDLSHDPSSTYVADGLYEGIVAALSRFRGFAVATPSADFPDRSRSLRDIANSLEVRYLLQGTIQRSGERIRVTVHLHDAPAGVQLWAERFDGTLADIFDLEDRVAEAVVGLVEPAISRAEIERARRKRPDSLDAYDHYLRALPLFRSIEPQARTEAIRLLEECVRLDAHFAPGLAYAAWAYERQDTFGTGMSDSERGRALALAEAAAEQGHDDPQVIAIAALILLMLGGEQQRGLAMLREANLANPNHPTVLSLFAFCNIVTGDLDLGRETFLRAIELSPASLVNFELLAGVASADLMRGEFEQAVEWSLRAIAANGEWLGAWWNLAASYGHLGKAVEAQQAVERMLELAPFIRVSHIERLRTGRSQPRWAMLVDGLAKAGLPP